MNWESQITTLILASLLRPMALVVSAWLLLRLFRVRHPASQHAVWATVLAGLLLIPALSVLAPHVNFAVLPAGKSSGLAQAGAFSEQPDPSQISVVVADESRAAPPSSPAGLGSTLAWLGSVLRAIRVWPPIMWCYLAGLLAMVAYHAYGWIILRRVIARSRPLSLCPLRESADVIVPVAAGWLRPTVILPRDWRTWSRDTREAVLAHEFAHIRRRDILVAALGRSVRCLLWFNPLAWWLNRKVAQLAELACDAAVLDQGADPVRYSRILLEFADRINRAGFRAALPGLAMASPSGLSKRVEQVFAVSGGNLRKIARPGVALAALGIPVACLAATVGVTDSLSRSVQPETNSEPSKATYEVPISSQVQPPPRVLLAQAKAAQDVKGKDTKGKTDEQGKAVSPSAEPEKYFVVFDRQGKLMNTIREPGDQPSFSPDKTRMAYTRSDVQGNQDIWVIEISTGGRTQITSSPAREWTPAWSPDGKQIAFTSLRDGSWGVYRKAASGAGTEELLYRHTSAQINLTDWSADGRFLCFFGNNGTVGTVFVLPLDGDRKPVELTSGNSPGGPMYGGRLSPDSRLLIYMSGGRVFVRTFDPNRLEIGAEARQVSGEVPARLSYWGANREIYYNTFDSSVMAVDVSTTPTLQAGAPRLLFQSSVMLGTGAPGVGSVSRDGERIVFAVPPPSSPAAR